MKKRLPARRTTISPSFRLFLREQIDKRGWSDSECARRAQIHKSTLCDLLANTDRGVSIETLDGLAEALELPLATLVELCGFDLGLHRYVVPYDERTMLAV